MKQFLIGSALVLSSISTLFADEFTAKNQLPTLPETIEQKGYVYGTLGMNNIQGSLFNASIGYQSGRYGVDLQTHILVSQIEVGVPAPRFPVIPVDISSHMKISTLGNAGNFYVGAGPFYSIHSGLGGEIIGGYRSTPKMGPGLFVELYSRPLVQNHLIGYLQLCQGRFDSTIVVGLGAFVAMTGYASSGLRAGIAF